MKGPLVTAFRSPLMRALDRSVETLCLCTVTSLLTFIKSLNQSSIKLCQKGASFHRHNQSLYCKSCLFIFRVDLYFKSCLSYDIFSISFPVGSEIFKLELLRNSLVLCRIRSIYSKSTLTQNTPFVF